MWKLVDKIQNTPDLKEIVTFTGLESFGRSLDKAFRGAVWVKVSGHEKDVSRAAKGAARNTITEAITMEENGERYGNFGSEDQPFWQKITDENKGELSRIVKQKINEEVTEEVVEEKARVGVVRTAERERVKFIQLIKDEDNPRYLFVRGLLSRYAPFKEDLKDSSLWDASLTPEQRFGYMSQVGKKMAAAVSSRGVVEAVSAGVPLEEFIHNVIDANLLTWPEMEAALRDVYRDEFVGRVIRSSRGLSGVNDDVAASKPSFGFGNPIKGLKMGVDEIGKQAGRFLGTRKKK